MGRSHDRFPRPELAELLGRQPGRGARRHHPGPPFPPEFAGPEPEPGRGRRHDHGPGHDHGYEPGYDPGYGPDHGPDHGPDQRPRHEHGPGFGPWGPGRGRGRGRRGERGRAQRGDVRTAMLMLLAEEPMHGYQLMQAMAERTGGVWRPSPGAVYPTIAQLEDEGLATTQVEGGRKLVTLTKAGQAYVEEQRATWDDPFAALSGDADGVDLRGAVRDVHLAAMHIAARGSRTQVEAAARALTEARRALYLILADDPGSTPTT